MRRDKSMMCLYKGRIAWFKAGADAQFWDHHWQGHLTRDNYRVFQQGHLGPFEGAFTRNLPKTGKILEAGCGMGQYVMALRARGYEVEGVEYGAATVKTVNEMWPGLPVTKGDVRRLEVRDGYYSAYISLGVVEHASEGPDEYLREAGRVLKPHGVAFLSVPFVNRLRQLKRWAGLYGKLQTGSAGFYQYAFDRGEFGDILRRHGFRLWETIPYDGQSGLRHDSVTAGRLFDGLDCMIGRETWLHRLVDRLFGHMALFVCKKEGVGEMPGMRT